MPKIRGIKPELWTDENFVELSTYARLLWIGMWNYACDNGHIQDKHKQIKMRVLPTDEVDAAGLLDEIAGQGLIERADGWITIPNLTHHQKPHKRWWVKCDKPGCELPEGASYGFEKTKPEPATTVDQPLVNGGTTVNNGCSTADVDVDVDGDGDGELINPSRPAPRPEPEGFDRFPEFWQVYDHRKGRKDAVVKWRSALRKRGVDADMLITAAGAYIDWVKSEGKHPRYTKLPATWLNGEHWTDERVASESPPTNLQSHLSLVEQLAAEERGDALPLQIGSGR